MREDEVEVFVYFLDSDNKFPKKIFTVVFCKGVISSPNVVSEVPVIIGFVFLLRQTKISIVVSNEKNYFWMTKFWSILHVPVAVHVVSFRIPCQTKCLLKVSSFFSKGHLFERSVLFTALDRIKTNILKISLALEP